MVVIGAFIWSNHQYISDSISFWQFKPTAEIAAISDRAKLSDAGKFTFYAVEPEVEDSSTFNKECQRKENGTAILGCYVNGRIFLYNVTETKLDGIKEVTAAHELLHAVYERMSPGEKNSVNKLVEAEYDKLKGNADFAERIAFYDRTEPGERDNELHSIIGTEVSSISPELEAHYKKYFNDRSAIVALHSNYSSAFTNLTNQAKQLSAQLDTLNDQIRRSSEQYNTDTKELNADIIAFNKQASGGGFSSKSQFDAQRQVLVGRASKINADRTLIDAMIDQYNALREQYNNLVTQSNNLYKSMDSSLAAPPKV
jgi:chaperonin cofactor prefoldin